MKNSVSSVVFAAAALAVGFSLGENSFEVSNLLSDGAVKTPNVNRDVVNAWGIAASPTGPFWIANEGTGTSSIILADGSQVAPDVAVPADHSGHPTGLVFNGGDGFPVSQGGATEPSRFIFVTLEGRILGWSPDVDAANAIVIVDNGASGAVYTGAALSAHDDAMFLYVANFANGTVDMFDENFAPAGSFTDPNVPMNYSPFGIAQISRQIYVTFVPRDPVTGDEVPGPGHGLIDVFSRDGSTFYRLTTGGELNAPWGLVRAASEFGPFANRLLVGNFGDGRILSFARNGDFLGQLEDEDGDAIVIDGLWGLQFGNGGLGGDTDDLYFTAGIQDEKHGLFGEIEPAR